MGTEVGLGHFLVVSAVLLVLGIYRPKPPAPALTPEPAHADAGDHGHGADHGSEVA